MYVEHPWDLYLSTNNRPPLFFLLLTILIQNHIHCPFGDQVILHILFNLAVFCVGGFFLGNELIELDAEFLSCGQLFDTQLIEGILCSFMQLDILPVGLEKFLTVTGFAVSTASPATKPLPH